MNVSTDPRTRAWVEVDLASLLANAQLIQRTAAGARLLPMVKANAYGLGVAPVVRTLDALDPWGYGVATVVEGIELRRLGVTLPIIVFTPALRAQLESYREHELRPVIDDVTLVSAWSRPYHLEVDTGMGRGGVRWDDEAALTAVRARPPEGVFTHFHSADEAPESVKGQLERFRHALVRLDRHPPLVHAGNSAGVFHLTEHFDLVRPGIFLYGGRVGPGTPEPSPVVSVRARIVSQRRVRRGDTVSYGAEWTAVADGTVATLGIGYADGILRSIQGRGSVLVHGQRFPVVGRVTMDMIMVDLGHDATETGRGDVVTLVGRCGDDIITVDEFAGWAETISYELLVGLGRRLPRLYDRE